MSTKKESRLLSITSCFDSGNIDVVGIKGGCADLKIKLDPFTAGPDNKSHGQWFHFKAANVRGTSCTFRIVNAGKMSYPDAFVGYWACCSYEPASNNWFRTSTKYIKDKGILSISVVPTRDVIWCAYFAPFSYEKHQTLIAACGKSPIARVRSVGATLDGRDMELISTGTGPCQAWLIARQHPGESMAEHWMAGFLARLLDLDDALAEHLRKLCTFHIVPNMNPDGSVRGHLRTNATGANLNREWADSELPSGIYRAPTLKRSPEVFHVLREMDATGVDFFIDVHGDEELPHTFLAGSQGVSKWSSRHAFLLATFATEYNAANPDFGDLQYGYGNDKAGTAKMCIASNQIGERFDCLSATLEMPYKDCYARPNAGTGMSPRRCEKLGASVLDAMAAVAESLRSKLEVDASTLPAWVMPGFICPTHKELAWKSIPTPPTPPPSATAVKM